MAARNQTKQRADPAWFKAAVKGDVVKLKAFLAANQSCDAADGTGKTALMHSAEQGNLEAVRILLGAGANATRAVSDRDSMWVGCNALIFAAQGGKPKIVQLLLEAGASPNCRATDDTTPLSFAVEHRSAQMVKDLLDARAAPPRDILLPSIWNSSNEISLLLIEAGANLNVCNDLGQSVIHRVAEQGNLELLRVLIKAKAKLDQKANGTTPLLIAVQNKHVDCALELIRAGADLSATAAGSRRTALMSAAVSGQAQLVQALLNTGADPNAKDHVGKTALMLANEKKNEEVVALLRAGGSDEAGYQVQEYLRAAERGDVEQVRHFLDAGVDVNAVYQNGAKALISAVMKGHADVVRLLLERGANASTTSTAKAWGAEFHADALALAADKGNLEIVRLLLRSGADVNKSRLISMDALNAAAHEGHTEVVRELLAAGHTLKAGAGLEALEGAIRKKHEGTALVLIEAGVKVSGKRGAGLLVTASEKGLARVVNALLAAGVDPKLRDEYDQTALQAAQHAGRKSIVALLQEASSPQASPGLELVEAAERGDSKTVRRLILEGVELESRDSKGTTALIRASANGHLLVMIELLKAGADPNAATQVKKRDRKELFHHMDLTFETPLSCAVGSRCRPAVDMLLDAGADITKAECGHLACMMLQEGTQAAAAFVDHLLDAGLDPNANWPVINVCALELAAQEGFTPLVRKLIQLGARLQNPNQRDRAILDAIQRNCSEIARVLVEEGIAPHVRGVITSEALGYAAMHGLDEIVTLLVERGVKIDELVRMSFEKDGTVDGVTSLMAAARHGKISTVKLLLDLGADPRAEDSLRRTAIDWATDNKNKNVAQQLSQLLRSGVVDK